MEIAIGGSGSSSRSFIGCWFRRKAGGESGGDLHGLGISTFLLGTLLVGFDAENLAVGIDACARGVPEVALGTIIGASMVAIPFALGFTMLAKPIKLDISRKGVLLVTPLAVLLTWLLSLDGQLSRLDGGLLLAGFAAILGTFFGRPAGD